MSNQQQGFTLVELIVVIVILGILAATALPRFINVTSEARIASIQGFAGGLRSGIGLAQAKFFVTGNPALTSITMADGTTIAVASGTGIPTAAAGGIGNAIAGINGCPGSVTGDCSGFTAAFGGGSATFQPSGGSSTCQVSYNASTGVITTTTSGCP